MYVCMYIYIYIERERGVLARACVCVCVCVSDIYITKTHTQELLFMNDQPIAKAATYTVHNKHNRRTFMSLLGFKPAILSIGCIYLVS